LIDDKIFFERRNFIIHKPQTNPSKQQSPKAWGTSAAHNKPIFSYICMKNEQKI
jgi:hypothetical protein